MLKMAVFLIHVRVTLGVTYHATENSSSWKGMDAANIPAKGLAGHSLTEYTPASKNIACL